MPSDFEAQKYRRNAPDHFKQAEKRDSLLKREQEKARVADQAKTARLRALRLAKESADAIEKEKETSTKQQEAAGGPRRRR